MSTSNITPVPRTAFEISSVQWMVGFFGMVALVAAINLFIAWRMDVFGILRDAHGRSLITSDHERKQKYLLNQAYVPENFDALLIGASASVNWRMAPIAGYRFYNESLEGGDASEERKLVEQALETGHFRAAVIVLYPRLTDLHLLQDGFDQVKRSEAFGSISLLGVEYDILHEHLGHVQAKSYPDGSHASPVHAPPNPSDNFGAWSNGFGSDPQALQDYRTLAWELANRDVRIVYVTYPMFESALKPNKDLYDRYVAEMLRIMPAGPLIDFNALQYLSFRNDANNYIDELHLSASGAERFSTILRAKVEVALADE